MIVTLTPNPSLDLLFTAEQLVWDDANRIPMPRRRAGGQGINVTRAARALRPHGLTHAIAPLGGPIGRELQEMLDAEGTSLTPVAIAGDTRVFVGVRVRDEHRSLLLNPRGPVVTDAEAEALLEALDRVLGGLRGSPWVVASGSLLPGLPADFYARVGRLARGHGARFVPDGDGEALARAVSEADLLVPNELEAARLVGSPIDSPESAASAGHELRARGAERVVITMGDRGAVAVTGRAAWWAHPESPADRVAALADGSAVGAGDAFLAGLLLAIEVGAPDDEALVAGVAAGTAALLSEGTDLVTREDADEVKGWVKLERLTTN